MNVKQLAFVELLKKWANGCLIDASYAVLGNELGVTPVAAFLRTKTLERKGYVRRKGGKLYLSPRFVGEEHQAQWDALVEGEAA